MGSTYRLEIVTREEGYPAREVQALDVPAADGRLTVLARHQTHVCAVRAGTALIVAADGGHEAWTIGPGVLTVTRALTTLLVSAAARQPA